MIAITNEEFRQLSEYIRQHYGIHLKEEKRALVMGRLQQVLVSKHFSSFKEYFHYVVSDRTGEAVMTLVDKITTNHTFFMREFDHFEFLRERVLPYLEAAVKDRDLRIWSAGCSSGEEPYTLAMLLDEYFGASKPLWDAKVLATDISAEILSKAQRGEFAADDLSALPASWRMKYFNVRDREHFTVHDKLKREVIFRKFNLMETTFPFRRKFHVIFCRNVMIYFDNPTKEALVNKFYQHLEPGGYLFIGHSESLQRETTPFKYVKPAIYRKD
ncbi:CheR family methyltransferase [Paenibacillus timonensis]|uniref:CheR family methyltransferase n=1 Tax=Paenibacillus timonensis TaxID=225915 RepID=UPI003F9AE0F2